VLDKSAMFKMSVRNPKPTRKHPEEFRDLSVKPLQLVWSKFGRWSAANTVQVRYNVSQCGTVYRSPSAFCFL
jgi:hypothetical protein